MKRQILLGLMASLTVAAYADQKSDAVLWGNIIEAGSVVGADADVQRAIIKVGVEFHSMITLIARKYSKQLSGAEKKLVVDLLNHMNFMIQKAKTMVVSGGQSESAQQELAGMLMKLNEMIMPIQMAMQERAAKGDAIQVGQKRLIFALELLQGLLQTMIIPMQQ